MSLCHCRLVHDIPLPSPYPCCSYSQRSEKEEEGHQYSVIFHKVTKFTPAIQPANEAIESSSLPLENVDNVHGGDSLPLNHVHRGEVRQRYSTPTQVEHDTRSRASRCTMVPQSRRVLPSWISNRDWTGLDVLSL